MYQFLNASFDETTLRDAARRTVGGMSIIQGAERGDPRAYGAMLSGWWFYVTGFEQTMRRQLVRQLPVAPLTQRYGLPRTLAFRRAALRAVVEMQEEEGSHAKMWEADAGREGFPLPLEDPCPTVRQLLDLIDGDAYPVAFWAQLAATEFIAECVTERLYGSPAFMSRFFPSGRWDWGAAHLPHEGEASHREMDLDIAVAFAARQRDVRLWVTTSLDLFAAGSAEVAERYL